MRASSTSTTLGPTSSAVLAAYRASWSAFEHAAADANPTDPELATMVDPQLQEVRANLLADQRQGIVGRGAFALHPKITALMATVVNCGRPCLQHRRADPSGDGQAGSAAGE